MAEVRTAHLLVRSAEEWTLLGDALSGAYREGDKELADALIVPYLHVWRSVAETMVADALEPDAIAVAAPTHPWGVATLSRQGRSCEPLLCEPESIDLANVSGPRPVLRDFEGVMAAYRACLEML